MLHRAGPCGCEEDIGMTAARELNTCEHGNVLVYVKRLGTKAEREGKRKPPPKRRASMSATPAQQAKVRSLPCARCGYEGDEYNPIDAAHLTDRPMGGCESELCVVPLCRRCHEAHHAHELELLPALIDRNYHDELAHAISEHKVSPETLVKRLTVTPLALVPASGGKG